MNAASFLGHCSQGTGKRVLAAAISLGLMGLGAGCASSSESAQRDVLTENVGKYDAPPRNAPKPWVGVPPFDVKTGQGFSGGSGDLNSLAADQMTTLLDNSERFNVVERAQLQKLLDEQNLEGIVKPGEMAKPAQVRGVNYLLLGKVTNLRVKSENKSRGFGLAQVGGSLFNAGGADIKKKDIVITSECGVDIRLVDPTTGQVVVSSFSEYKKTDTAGAMGVDILGASAEADADIKIDEDDKGKILRLALDDSLRKAIPKIDKFLTSGNVKGAAASMAPSDATVGVGEAKATATPAAVTPANANTAAPVEKPAAASTAKKFCPECGKEVAAGAKFCPADGTKIP